MVRKRLELIQFSRALVPFMVMLFHLSGSMMGYFDYNLLGLSFIPISGGVNYFFALTGFMMFYIYHRSFGQTNQLKSFLLNRFIRIYPLYWLLTCLSLFVLLLYPSFNMGHETDIDTLITSFLLVQSPRELEPVLTVAWSLVHTVFFYLVFSLLFFSRVNISKAIITIWALLTIAFSLGYLYIDHFLINFFFNQYNLIFLAGILCAYYITHFKINLKVSILMIIIGGLGFPVLWLAIFFFFNVCLSFSYVLFQRNQDRAHERRVCPIGRPDRRPPAPSKQDGAPAEPCPISAGD